MITCLNCFGIPYFMAEPFFPAMQMVVSFIFLKTIGFIIKLKRGSTYTPCYASDHSSEIRRIFLIFFY